MNARSNAAIPDYLSYPKKFLPYKWYKPLLTVLLSAVFFGLIGGPISFLNPSAMEAIKNGTSVSAALEGGYDNLDVYSPLGALVTFGGIASFLLAILIANRIVNARPFCLGSVFQKPRRCRRAVCASSNHYHRGNVTEHRCHQVHRSRIHRLYHFMSAAMCG